MSKLDMLFEFFTFTCFYTLKISIIQKSPTIHLLIISWNQSNISYYNRDKKKIEFIEFIKRKMLIFSFIL